MIKYTPQKQLTLESFKHPFEQSLSPDNRWVKLAEVIPWDDLAEVYIQGLNSKRGRESINVRMVIGALIVKHKLGLDDRGTVTMISENIYLQYFCGLCSFQTQEPFHPTVFVDIRKRMGAMEFDKWNVLIIEKAEQLKSKGNRNNSKKENKEENEEKNKEENKEEDTKDVSTSSITNKGTLKLDATVANQKIVYPTDAGLLNRCREECERLTDLFYKQVPSTEKPRDYRRVARKEYLSFSKNRRKSKKAIRKFIGKQLRYVSRDLKHLKKLLEEIASKKAGESVSDVFPELKSPLSDSFPGSSRDREIYETIQKIYAQQKQMYDEKTHICPHRIVNIYQPYVRPIVRGKDKVNVEFGAKISASEVEGMSRVEHISWENFNEALDLKLQVGMFKETFGFYPELLLVDCIYLNRENRKWLKEKGIRIVGKPLGRPPKEKLSAYEKQKRRKEQNQRNLIEGKFGQGKNAYGLSNIQAKRSDTSESWISAIFFVMNLISLSKIAEKCAIFLAFFKKEWYVLQKHTFLFFKLKGS